MSSLQIVGFDVLSKIGEGGMAAVWKARQISLDRIVAIKILPPRMVVDDSDLKRFQAEAQAAAKLKHPGIVQVYDASFENDLYYFVMEYVAGYTVGDWLRRKGTLSEKDTLLVVDCVADALGYAWENQRIIHCDIKPDNIMVDADGTVKVADLGLARTISAMSASREVEEVMGTPAYMSPEQGRGDPDLDCRADMYSLGAMLYHLVTGRLLFDGDPDTVITNQISAQAPDPLETNTHLSNPMCLFMEGLLAKDREARPADWGTVRKDAERVGKGLAPGHRMPHDKVSTVRRSRSWDVAAVAEHRPGLTDEARSPLLKVLLLVLFALLAAAGYKLLQQRGVQQAGETVPVQPSPAVAVDVPAVSDPNGLAEHQAEEMFNFAVEWAASHPDEYDVALQQFTRVTRDARGTKYALMAQAQARELRVARDARTEAVMADLQARCDALAQSGKLLEASELMDAYDGVLASRTIMQRQEAGRAFRQQHALAVKQREEDTKRRQQRRDSVLAQLDDTLVTQGVEHALPIAKEAATDPLLTQWKREFASLCDCLAAAASIDEVVLDSFRAMKGESATVQTVRGAIFLVINDVKGGSIIGTERFVVGGRDVYRDHTIPIKDLSPRERLLRMGADDKAEVALVKGLMAYAAGSFEYAEKYFAATHPLISERLLERVRLAQGVGGPVLRPADPAPLDGTEVDATPFVLPVDQEQLRLNLASVLAEANRGLKLEDVTVDLEGTGKIRMVTVSSPYMTDLRPFARLPDLKGLVLAGTSVSDLTPLTTLNLRTLDITDTPVLDLSPLRLMHLNTLKCNGLKVGNYDALTGLSVRELWVDLNHANIRTLLGSMPNLKIINGEQVPQRPRPFLPRP